MADLKKLPSEAVPSALEKALRYRLLGEPQQAESICLDILATEPDHRDATITLLLAQTDQFASDQSAAVQRARQTLSRLRDDYDLAYYEGIIHERWARAQRQTGVPTHVTAGWILEAMRCYERAQRLAPANDPDALLRWNACARDQESISPSDSTLVGMRHDVQADYGDDMPQR